ncbi:DUF1289 domain-containing protein [Sulfurirhabdus autotrophica]|uniref:Uncharacterized protein DUF1289 n=1 Tax=Sulfurirhabdus autotrophica TaxID=1706046 RepID=A0A4V6P406_9PROT|nr:DUF1289 domain-containing protein [Sulfurirhabdus autotrophica]TCV90279.1 uncharacterized protein DUF1289 [Sulfurirhabdus autotrophica]
MNDFENRVESPCVRNCCLNDDDDCLGCFRSLNEIMQWSQATDEERRDFLLNAENRRKAYNLKWNTNR